MSILKFLGLDRDGSREDGSPAAERSSAETETVRKIVESLDRMEPERARFVAAFAYILSRVAHADLEISAEETRAMERIVMKVGGLPEEQALLVVQMAKTQSLLFGGTENYLVTREFNRIATREQKLSLLECLFAVGAADESISTVESNEIRRVANELKLSHRDYIAMRSAYRRHLAVLKDSGSPEG
ncbi:MAG: TerB family tellurite resistance protein [Acidobacteriota bacterium]